MAFANYAELDDAIDRWLDRTDRTDEIQEWVRLVEADVVRRLGLRAQQLSTTGTLTGGTNVIETPAGILAPKVLVFDGSPPIVVDTVTLPEGVEAAYLESGRATPTKATVWGINAATNATKILVWPTPAANAGYTLYYEAGAITALTAAAPTNYLLLVAPDVYFFGALMHAQMFDENPEGALQWSGLFEKAVRDLKRVEAVARMKGGRIAPRPRSPYSMVS